MGRPQSLSPGDVSHRLTVIEYTGRAGYLCRCECGNATVVQTGDFKNGRIKSCGCYRREEVSARMQTHGHSRSRKGGASATYASWQQMRQRCENPKHHKWAAYGGAGIRVCERWATFENFLADMGQRPEKTTLDRIDGTGNYEPANCRWADIYTQNRNRRPKRKR